MNKKILETNKPISVLETKTKLLDENLNVIGIFKCPKCGKHYLTESLKTIETHKVSSFQILGTEDIGIVESELVNSEPGWDDESIFICGNCDYEIKDINKCIEKIG